MRGIEIYRNRPIFYSLGNFIFQNDTVAHLPADFYEKQGLGSEHNVIDALEKRSDNGKRGLGVNPMYGVRWWRAGKCKTINWHN